MQALSTVLVKGLYRCTYYVLFTILMGFFLLLVRSYRCLSSDFSILMYCFLVFRLYLRSTSVGLRTIGSMARTSRSSLRMSAITGRRKSLRSECHREHSRNRLYTTPAGRSFLLVLGSRTRETYTRYPRASTRPFADRCTSAFMRSMALTTTER